MPRVYVTYDMAVSYFKGLDAERRKDHLKFLSREVAQMDAPKKTGKGGRPKGSKNKGAGEASTAAAAPESAVAQDEAVERKQKAKAKKGKKKGKQSTRAAATPPAEATPPAAPIDDTAPASAPEPSEASAK